MTPAERDAAVNGRNRPIALSLTFDASAHRVTEEREGVLRCLDCGAGCLGDKPLWPSVCDRVGYRRRMMGLG